MANHFGRQAIGTIRGVVLPVSIAASGIGAPLYGFLLDSELNPDVVWDASMALYSTAVLLLLIVRPLRRPTLEIVRQPRATVVAGERSVS